MTPLRTLITALDAAQPLADSRAAAKAAYHAALQASDGLSQVSRATFPSVLQIATFLDLTICRYFDTLGENGLNAWRAQLKTWLESLPKAERDRLLETGVLA